MLSFDMANDLALSGVCPIPLLKCVEYATASNVMDVIILWFALTAIYHMMVSFMSGDDCEFNLRRWKVHCRKGQSHCRFARFYRCQKRTQRRHKFASDNKNDQCPISRMFCSHPPPLPFHRRRKCMWSCAKPEGTKSTSSDSSQTEEVQTQVNESVENILPTTTQDPTKKKRRRKSRPSSEAQRPLEGPLVLDLARMQRWPYLEERLKISRREAKKRDAEGLYPLHWACSGGPPVSAVQALLDAYPRAARRVDADGSTALHMAAHYGGSAAVIETLIEAHPPAVRVQDRYGRTPLYHATKKRAGLDVLRALLKAAPEMATVACAEAPRKSSHRSEGRLGRGTPLYVVWLYALSSLKSRRRGRNRDWDKADLLLQAAYLGYFGGSDSSLSTSSCRRNFQLLHAAISLDAYLPEDVVPRVLDRYPEQVSQVDKEGRLPLAIAASQTQVAPQRSDILIKLLLEAYPQAAQVPDSSGRFPLMLALASGKRWEGGVERLFWAAPDRLHHRDFVTWLYPAMLAATAVHSPRADEDEKDEESLHPQDSFVNSHPSSSDKAIDWHRQVVTARTSEEETSESPETNEEASHVSTIFELLQADPAVIRHAVA